MTNEQIEKEYEAASKDVGKILAEELFNCPMTSMIKFTSFYINVSFKSDMSENEFKKKAETVTEKLLNSKHVITIMKEAFPPDSYRDSIEDYLDHFILNPIYSYRGASSTFSINIGRLFKYSTRISPNGVSFKIYSNDYLSLINYSKYFKIANIKTGFCYSVSFIDTEYINFKLTGVGKYTINITNFDNNDANISIDVNREPEVIDFVRSTNLDKEDLLKKFNKYVDLALKNRDNVVKDMKFAMFIVRLSGTKFTIDSIYDKDGVSKGIKKYSMNMILPNIINSMNTYKMLEIDENYVLYFDPELFINMIDIEKFSTNNSVAIKKKKLGSIITYISNDMYNVLISILRESLPEDVVDPFLLRIEVQQ